MCIRDRDDDDDDDDDGGGDDHRDKLQLVAGQRKRISLTNCVCNQTTAVTVSRNVPSHINETVRT